MNNIVTIIKKELARFFGDKRLVFTTVIMPGLLIFLMYSLMGEGMMKQLTTEEDYVAKGYAVNMPSELEPMMQGLNIDWETWDGKGEEKKDEAWIERCDKGHRNGIMLDRNNINTTDLYEAERQNSYLAKLEQKENVQGKTFFTSRIKKRN